MSDPELKPLQSVFELSLIQWLAVAVNIKSLADYGKLWFGQTVPSKTYPPETNVFEKK